MLPARKAQVPTVTQSAGQLLPLLLLLLLFNQGAQALECYSCVQRADDGCNPHRMKVVKCSPGVEVCTEAVGAVETIHGQFSVAVRGCGSGLPGKNDRGLDLHGLFAFIQLQQCAQDRCNAKLNLTSRGLNPAGNESAYEPNGAECYSCVGLSREQCRGSAPPVVRCFNASDRAYTGCFDGNVTLTAANVTVSLPVRGCVQDEACTRDGVTGPGFTLSGSCCQGPRCNSDLRNKTYFSSRIPPLVLLPASTSPAPTTRGSATSSRPPSTPAPTTPTSATKPTPASASQPPPHAAEPEVAPEKDRWLAGGAMGHQDRSNVEQYPGKGGTPNPQSKGSGAAEAGLATLLVAVAAGVLL
ncbi:ly6/PLAUR domain-containing protein 3 [Perognathus longimembris pacificus]|uniref:ly6/PLAUR domain-containing protein 3 n=1 Tax=Perognathus longimembris pacificus TaxID=214514 RepID=UPI00201881FA|nr:ly6/PLAUR domain-containing protein 3 [Perognathus longimembris pacificus]